MLGIDKSNVSMQPEVAVDKKLNVLHLIEQIAASVEAVIRGAYENDDQIELDSPERVNKALQNIRGKMQALRFFVSSVR